MNDRSRPGPALVTRRSLLEWLGGATVVALGSPLLEACGAAGARDASDAEPCRMEPGTIARPELQGWAERTVDPQDLAAIVASWKLRIGGLVAEPAELGFCELRGLGLVTQVTDFHCVEGWSVYDVPWNGVPLSKLLDLVQPKAGATYLEIHCVGGKYLESLELSVAREPRSMLGLGIDGSTLPLKHGFPARVVVPRLFGYKNAKFVERIELVDYEPQGYWSSWGYTNHGQVTPSRLRPGKY